MRKGRYEQGQAAASAIHVTFYDNEDFPTGGHSVAKWDDDGVMTETE